MDSITIVTTPKSILANQSPAYSGCSPTMESSGFQSPDAARDISAGLLTAMVAIPLSLSIGIVVSVKLGLATLAGAYVIGWILSRSQDKR